MDRNVVPDGVHIQTYTVATREGGVDRNIAARINASVLASSPPARVAWIETFTLTLTLLFPNVATREGGVDRNKLILNHGQTNKVSPPARVAWIETRRW